LGDCTFPHLNAEENTIFKNSSFVGRVYWKNCSNKNPICSFSGATLLEPFAFFLDHTRISSGVAWRDRFYGSRVIFPPDRRRPCGSCVGGPHFINNPGSPSRPPSPFQLHIFILVCCAVSFFPVSSLVFSSCLPAGNGFS